MKIKLLYLSFVVVLSFSTVFPFEDSTVVVKEKNVNLLNIRSTSRVSDEDSTIFLYLSFDGKSPNFFYEIIHDQKNLVLSFTNTRLGGFSSEDSTKEINLGPVKTIYFDEKVKDKNEELPGMNPELYYVTEVTLHCDPVPKTENSFDIISENNIVSLTIPWPDRYKNRSRLYLLPPKKRTGLIAALTGIGVATLAGTGLLIWELSGKKDEPEPLKPVLPEHPSMK